MSTCVNPIQLKDVGHVPCGKCTICYQKRVACWSVRLQEEEKQCSSSHFVTLTYDIDHVPITENGLMNLKKRDLQNYFKRLRKINGKKLKYYACGEYGGKSWRPHYHIILFNSQPDKIIDAWSLDNKALGHVHIGQVSEASIVYTLKYISKPKRVPRFKGDDRQKEFALMSKGMGITYLDYRAVKWHKEDLLNRMYIPLKDGKKSPMPRYYKDKLYTSAEYEAIKQRIEQSIEEKFQKIIAHPCFEQKLRELKEAKLRLAEQLNYKHLNRLN